MGIEDGKLRYFHGVAEGNVYKKISTLEYNNKTIYECFNNTFTADFCNPDLNIPLITIDDRPHPHKISWYNPYLIPTDISVASENYVSTLTTPSDYPDLLPSDDHNTLHIMKKGVTLKGMFNRGYCYRKHGQIRCYKNTRFYCSTWSDKKNIVCYFHGFSSISSETRTRLL